MDTKIECWAGYSLNEGDKVVRIHKSGHITSFKFATVVNINPDRKYGDSVGILTEGRSKVGWTYPSRVINCKAFK